MTGKKAARDLTTQSDAAVRTASRLWPKVLVYVAVILTWIVLSRLLPLEAWLIEGMAAIEALGPAGLLLFIVLYIPACVLMLPDILPNAAAGAVWGIGTGTVVVSLGRTAGSTVTFLLMRTAAGPLIDRRMKADPRFAAISAAVARRGFRFIVLLRLCPIFPVIMLNYALGMTRVRLRAYVMGTLIGMLPRTLFVAWAGSGARSLADLAAMDEWIFSGHILFYGAGFAISLGIVVYLGWKARQLVQEALNAAGLEDAADA
jgi:uncharacterized membrane protein YdjX (TVP38/TMEM64 family)